MSDRKAHPPSKELPTAQISTHLLRENGDFPNNPALPVMIYRGLFDTNFDPSRLEQIVKENHWGGTWRNGIYPYHHYHSTAHELLVLCSGTAVVELGGEGGKVLKLETGDAIVLPAGVAHRKSDDSPEFEVLGAYPEGQDWDLCYGKPEERPDSDRRITRVKLPKADPFFGAAGPLLEEWH